MNTQQYFKDIETKVKVAYDTANEARAKGLDPKDVVEIPLARSLAEKVVGLISTVYPQINDPRIVKRIIELEKEYGKLDPAVSLKIAEEVAKQKFCEFANLLEAIEAGIRVGFAYATLGVVSSPIEGFTSLKTGKTREGKEYFIAYFSGPIRSAGTTASCVVLLIIDHLREVFGFAEYDPTEKEIKRTITELYDYHERVANLQYLPTIEEIEFLAKHLSIQVNGEPSSEREVSNYKNLERVETNLIRGGFCLILGEGLAQKAQKALRILTALRKKEFKLSSWDFLEEYVELHKKRDKGKTDDSPTYIKDIVAGRPIFGHPSKSGGFRFRYGRSRVAGFSAVSVHPATMAISDDFIAIGTQLKIEKPTKGCVVSVCDSIDGPIVKLFNGSVKKINTPEEAKKIYPDVEEILYLGDILFPFSDLSNRNQELIKPGYVEEWWKLELKEKDPIFTKNIDCFKISFEEAIEISRKYQIPLHPKFIFYWTQISKEELAGLIDWIKHAKVSKKLIFPFNKTEQERFKMGKRALELLGVEHIVTIENVVLSEEDSKALLTNFGEDYSVLDNEGFLLTENFNANKINTEIGVLENINHLCKTRFGFEVKDKAGDFIGARMGRPEKGKLRKLVGSPNVLFPVGREGGRLRSVQAACQEGKVRADFPIYYCENCKKDRIYFICEECGNKCSKMYYCPECRQKFSKEVCPEHAKGQSFCSQSIDIKHYFDKARDKILLAGEEVPALIKGVRGTSSANHLMEHLSKGVLRALFNLQVNKDGTIRYDATELPITSFKPKEIFVSIEKLKEIGYDLDIDGLPLENENQILELKPHDIILPACPDSNDEGADEVFIKVANFIDLLLVRFYGLKPFYNIRKSEDLIGQLGVCMAPHNCAGVICRFIGFSKTQGLLASPYMHAAMRRDCLGYDNYISIKDKGGWRIEKIGGLVERLDPQEKADAFGTLKKKISDTFVWGNPNKGKISEVTKHIPTNFLRIYLEDGRKIELTENHKVYTKGMVGKKAVELQPGEKLIINYKKRIQDKEIKEIFLPEIFKDRDDIMIRGIKDYLSKFERLESGSNFYQRDSFPIKMVEEILSKYNKTLQNLPSYSRIAVKRDNVSLPIRILLNEDLLEVMGLYLAEGFSRKNDSKKGFYQISVASIDEKLKNLIKAVFYSHFGLKPSENHMDHVTFSSRIIYELFKDYFKFGENAKNKRIPGLFLNLKKEKLAALLRGYYEGDGSVSLSDNRVTCDTVSEGLKYDLSFVLSRFDIFTKFYEYEKEPGPQVKQFYLRKNRKIPLFKITKIIIPSNFVKRFEKIGFISKRKKRILTELCKKVPRGMKIDFDKDYIYPKIVKIEKIGKKESYCFNVAGNHNFFANDVLVHNCDGDEASIMLLLDVLLNFSREFLPGHRGGTQDAPLVLNARIDAGEVDEQILDFELVSEYPLELYRRAELRKHSSEIKISDVKQRIKEEKDPFVDIRHTHETSDFNAGVLCSSYKKLATMQEKVKHQMELVEKIRAADTADTARLIIERHFIRDMRGNLRKFSMQQFRCVACNEIIRRPPLSGVCPRCQGKIIFTIHEGGIKKYLEIAMEMADKYNLPSYLKQSIELTKRYIDSVFGKELEQQENLKRWF